VDIGTPELLVILVIVILIFGVGRLSKLGAEAGQALRDFRRGVAGEDEPAPAPRPVKPSDLSESKPAAAVNDQATLLEAAPQPSIHPTA